MRKILFSLVALLAIAASAATARAQDAIAVEAETDARKYGHVHSDGMIHCFSSGTNCISQ
jgi:uncharacterized membrane protein